MSDTLPTTETTPPADNPTAPKYQAIACRKAMPDDAQQDPPKVGYATPEAAAARCKELGHDVSDMEDHDDAYVFHQRAAPECKDAGEPEVSDIEDGMKGIGCGKAAEIAPSVTDEKNPYEKVPELGKPGMKGKRGTVKAGAAGASGGGERAAVAGGNADEIPRIPAGAQFVKDYCGLHDQGQAIHAEHKGLLENQPIAEASERWAEEDAERSEELNAKLEELYPEVSFPDAPIAPGVDDVVPVEAQIKDGDDDDDDDEKSITQAGEDSSDTQPDAMTRAATPDEDDMPYTAKYLQKVAGHIDAGQAMLNSGLKKQESPPVKDLAAEELTRLDDRKEEAKALMKSEHPDHVEKVFPETQEIEGESTTEEPSDKPEQQKEEKPKTTPTSETDPVKDDDKKPEDKNKKQPKKAAPSTNADLLKELVKSVDQLTATLTAKQVPPVAKAAPITEPAVDPEIAQQVAALEETNAALRKQVATLITHEKRFNEKLASHMGVNGKKKARCNCGGTCGTCKGYFSPVAPTKDMGVTDETAGGALVPTTGEEEAKRDGPVKSGDRVEIISTGQQGTVNIGQPTGSVMVVVDLDSGKTQSFLASDVRKKFIESAKKSYRLAATFNGKPILLPPGRPVPVFASDFRIEDEDGALFDNRVWQDFEPAERMLMQLGK